MTEQNGTPTTAKASATAEPKRRSVGFPQMPLGQAVEAIVTIGRNGGDHTHDAASAYLGHSTANSGAFRVKLAALRDWGLLARGDRNRVILSELAKDLVLAIDEGTEHELVLHAFDSCAVFKKVYDDQAKNIPLEEQRLRTVVVMRHGVASDQADKFVASFVDSVAYAGLGSVEGDRLTLISRETALARDDFATDPADEAFLITPAHAGPAPVSAPPAEQPAVAPATVPVALRQAWPIDGGEIEFIIRTPKAMPAGIYKLMADMADVATQMAELLKPVPPTVGQALMHSISSMGGPAALPSGGMTSGSSLGGATSFTDEA